MQITYYMKVKKNIKSAFTGAAVGIAIAGLFAGSLLIMQSACGLALLTQCFSAKKEGGNNSNTVLIASATIFGLMAFGWLSYPDYIEANENQAFPQSTHASVSSHHLT